MGSGEGDHRISKNWIKPDNFRRLPLCCLLKWGQAKYLVKMVVILHSCWWRSDHLNKPGATEPESVHLVTEFWTSSLLYRQDPQHTIYNTTTQLNDNLIDRL